MACLILPVSLLRRTCCQGYQKLDSDGGVFQDPVTVVVGREKRVFFVDPFILEENPFKILMDMAKIKESDYKIVSSSVNDDYGVKTGDRHKSRVIFVDVDSILFEHMLWLVYNDFSSLFKLNVREIVDFYAQDY
jgi:hypothetical protein